MGRPLVSLVHPDDVAKVREQLLPTDTAGMLDSPPAVPVPRVHLTARRGFICRMRIGFLNFFTAIFYIFMYSQINFNYNF